MNVHRFSSLAKKGLGVLIKHFEEMVISVGFCIESRCDEEMPEVLCGCGTIIRPSHYMAAAAPAGWSAATAINNVNDIANVTAAVATGNANANIPIASTMNNGSNKNDMSYVN
jgi:hypothetical protein